MFDEPEIGRQRHVEKLQSDYGAMMKTVGVIVCRGGEVHLVNTAMYHLITDTRLWATVFVTGIRPQIKAAMSGMSGLDAFWRREVLDGLDAWLANPDANAHQVEWLIPLAGRQRLLPDVLKVESKDDLDRLISAILATSNSQRVDIASTFDLSLPISHEFEETMQQLERGAETLLMSRMQLYPSQNIEWILTDATLRSAVSDAGPSLSAVPRLTEILETTSPYLHVTRSDGPEADLAMTVAAYVFQDMAYRAEVEN